MASALLTKTCPPKTSDTMPNIMKINDIQTFICLAFAGSCTSSALFSEERKDQTIYPMKSRRKTAPSTRLMVLLAKPESPRPTSASRVPVIPHKKRSRVTTRFTGTSRLLFVRVMSTGAMRAEMPSTKAVLKTLEPTMLPTEISALPCMAPRKLTTISGAEVPMATIDRPITKSLIPSFLAILEEPSTSTSAPMSTSARPEISSRITTARLSDERKFKKSISARI